jgi:Glucodextranase, domain B
VLDQSTVDPRQWFFPGTAGFQGYSTNDSPSVVAPGVATIRNQLNAPNPESILKGVGGITYTTTPSAEQFVTNGDVFVQKYTNLSIPAGGTTRLEFIYTMDDTAAHLDTRIGSAESSFGASPAITVTSPDKATAAAYTLSGTVTAPEGLNGLTVNNAPVAVATNGSFSVPETLANGANAFTLAATDELGRTTTTPFSVTLSTGPPPGNVAAVVFGRKGKVTLKGRTLTTALTASCPGTGPDCSITAVATSGRKKAGSAKATVKANATAGLKIKLTKAGAKLLKRKHKLTLKLTGKRNGAANSSVTSTVKLKTKKK